MSRSGLRKERKVFSWVWTTLDCAIVLKKALARRSVKVRGEFLLMCLVHNVKRSVKKVLEGTVSLSGKYSRLIEEAMLEYKEEQLTLVKAEV